MMMLLAAALVAWSVSIDFCKSQDYPVACLNELVMQAHPHSRWAFDPEPKDNSETVISRGVVQSWDCKDYAKTLASLIVAHDMGEPKIISCSVKAGEGLLGHRYVVEGGIYYDRKGGHRKPSGRYDCGLER